MTEALAYLSATDLGLKPGDLVLVAPEAVRPRKAASFHALQPDQLASRTLQVAEVNHTIVFATALRIGRDSLPLKDASGKFVLDGYTHRHFPKEARIFLRASPAVDPAV